MMGKKTLSEIRESLLHACAEAGVDPATWFDEQICKTKGKKSPNATEIETLELIRDGLRADASRKRRAPKNLPARARRRTG